jgi:hypothetical protein
MSKVNPYVTHLQKALMSGKFIVDIESMHLSDTEYINLNEETPQLSFLHTGSIPEQFGKPMMSIDQPKNCRFPELTSDHDIMFVMEHLPVYVYVYEKELTIDKTGLWFAAEINGQTGQEEFVKIIPMMKSSPIMPYLKNSTAMTYLEKTVAKILGIQDNRVPANECIRTLCREYETSLHFIAGSNGIEVGAKSYRKSLTHTGPSVNMKVLGRQDKEFFDCDFLLTLPVSGWPAPAREWRTRSRSWPRLETVNWLATLPCHVIPKPSKEGDKESWRFSFSCQEVEISTRNKYFPMVLLCQVTG